MSRETKGSLNALPPACQEAVDRALARDKRDGAGDIHDLVLTVARAVWRAGIRHGREKEQERRALVDRRLARRAGAKESSR